jgi:hypothetical protein
VQLQLQQGDDETTPQNGQWPIADGQKVKVQLQLQHFFGNEINAAARKNTQMYSAVVVFTQMPEGAETGLRRSVI